jgi:2-dehydro-3-deoxyglucarate aldolase
MSTLRQRLRSGAPVLGSWINTASPIVAELMSAAGFDFLAVDIEHSPVDLPGAGALFQAIRSGNPSCAPFARVQGHSYAEIKRYMDAGAVGIVCPLVNTRADAEELVQAVKYPPRGRRGVGFCRDNLYGRRLEEQVRDANGETVVCVQIEHIEGVRNIDAILAVEGVDAAFIGPYDLSASLGLPARFEHPDYLAARRRILDACRARGVVAGIHVVQPSPAQVAAVFREGFRLLAYSLDITMLNHMCLSGLREIRERLAAAP